MEDESFERAEEYMERIIERLKPLSFKEVLSYAIHNEEDEANYYRELGQKTKRPSVKALFLQMSDESLEHRERLYNLFKKLFPGEEPVKVDAPPVEVAPFYSEFERAEDYLTALEYCMKSELFAKRTYEILSKKALDDDARALFTQLAMMEGEHYNRLKKVYDLISGFEKRKMQLSQIEPGGYLFEDRLKARYLFLDLTKEKGKGIVITREHPKKLRYWMKEDVDVLWISEGGCKLEGVRSMPVKIFLNAVPGIMESLSENGYRVVLFETVEYLLVHLPEKEVVKLLLDLRDQSIANEVYLLISANREAFTPTTWAILRSNVERL